ncbi:unnamed protein product [Camellia sinensis]
MNGYSSGKEFFQLHQKLEATIPWLHLYGKYITNRFHSPPFHSMRIFTNYNTMKFITLVKTIRPRPTLPKITGPLQSRSFQPDFVPRDPKASPKRYKYPAFYNPYGPRPPPSDKIIQLAERIASLPIEERVQIGPTLRERLKHPKMQPISVEGMDVGPQGVPSTTKAEEKKVEKMAFDVKLEKFDTAAKIKVIKEVRAFTNLGLKEAKDLVEKAPVVLKQGVTKEEANDIIEKVKAAGGVAIME